MSHRFLRRADAQTIIQKLATKAIMEHRLVMQGDRILIAASGGKDSTVMAWAMSALRPVLKIQYEIEALHISTDFCACCKKTVLKDRLAEWEIPFTDLDVPVIGRLKTGRKMNCYWCSTQRRTELLRYAMEKGFNKVALGHHLDDIVETFFMNMMNKGEFTGMPIMLPYRKYPVSIIRPLAYIEEQQIITCADQLNILSAACTCPYGINSDRREIRKKIAALTENSGAAKRRIFTALLKGEKNATC